MFDWLRKKPKFKRRDDAYAMNRESLWNSVKKSIEALSQAQNSIWLIAHFPNTYLELQTKLDQWHVDYDVVTQPIDINQLERSGLLSTKVKLVLSDLVPQVDEFYEPGTHTQSERIAMMIVERHPQVRHDQRLESFARSIPVPVEFGYFNALDDVVLGLAINDTMLTILQQLGLNEHELITSTMVTRRVDQMLKRSADKFQTDHPADTAREWLELNG